MGMGNWKTLFIGRGNESNMSSYKRKAVNPKTGKEELAWFLDDFYGRHQYAVRFKDGGTYPIEEIQPS